MFSFLSAPALTDAQVAQTAQATQSGYKEGAEAVDAAQQRVADAAAADKKEKAAAALEKTKLDAAALKEHIATLRAGAKETYDTTRSKIADTIAGLDKTMTAPGVSPNSPEYAAANIARGIAKEHLDTIDTARAKALATGEPESEAFDPDAAKLTGTSSIPMLPLTQRAQLEKTAEEDSKIFGAANAKFKFNKEQAGGAAGGGAGATKVSTNAARAADAFSGAQSMLADRASAVAGLSKDVLTGKAKDPVGLRDAWDTMQKVRGDVQSNYAKIVNYAAGGDYGADVQSAYNGLTASLPKGTDPSNVAAHSALRASLATKQQRGTLTEADRKLTRLLRLDQDVSGAWNSSTALSDWAKTGVPMTGLGAPPAQPAGASAPPLLSAPSNSDNSDTEDDQ